MDEEREIRERTLQYIKSLVEAREAREDPAREEAVRLAFERLSKKGLVGSVGDEVEDAVNKAIRELGGRL